jgi:hypothetical protein
MNNFAVNVNTNSYFLGKLGEPYFWELIARRFFEIQLLGEKAPSRNRCNKIWFPRVFLGITVKYKVPAKIFLLETLFLTVISKGTWGNHIFWELEAVKKAPSKNTCIKISSPRISWKELFEISCPQKYIHSEPYFWQLCPGQPRGTICFRSSC